MLEQLDFDMSFKVNINLTPYTKSNSKCYVKSKSIKFPEENNITRKPSGYKARHGVVGYDTISPIHKERNASLNFMTVKKLLLCEGK